MNAKLSPGSVLACCLGLGALVVLAMLTSSTTTLYLAVAAAAAVGQVAVVWVAARGWTLAHIPIVVVNTMLTAALLFWDDVRLQAAVSAGLPASEEHLGRAVLIGLVFTTGVAAAAVILRPAPLAGTALTDIEVPFTAIVAIAGVAIATAVIGRGEYLMEAPRYLAVTGPPWANSLASTLAPFATLGLFYAIFRKRHPALGTVLLTVVVLLMLGAASRQIALIPAFAIIAYLLAKGRRPRILTVLAAALVTGYLAQLALTLRGNPEGTGVARAVAFLIEQPQAIVSQFDPRAVIGNLLFSGPLTARVADLEIPRQVLWTSVTPLPSGLTDWAIWAPRLRVNSFTPFNALGELAAYGWWTLALYGLMVGLALSALSRALCNLSTNLRMVALVLLLALAVAFSLALLQYNLRSGTRLLWYGAAATLLFRAFSARRAEQLPWHRGRGTATQRRNSLR